MFANTTYLFPISQYKSGTSIAEDASESLPIDIANRGARGMAVRFPADWTAGSIGFLISHNGSDYYPVLKSDYTRVVIENIPASDAGAWVIAPPELWILGAAEYLKLESLDGAGAALNQAAARSLEVLFLI